MSGHWRTTIRPLGFTAPIRDWGYKTFELCWPIITRLHPLAPDGTRVFMLTTVDHPGPTRGARDEGAGLAGRLRRRTLATGGDSRTRQEPVLDLADIQGLFSAGTGCRWCGISYWRWNGRHRRAGNSDGSWAATSPTARRSPLPQTGMWDSRPDQATICRIRRSASRTIALTSASLGRGWWR